MQSNNNIPELKSPFEQLKEVDVEGKEWWNSRKLARVMGYGKYWRQFLEVAFIDMAELRARDHVVMTMAAISESTLLSSQKWQNLVMVVCVK